MPDYLAAVRKKMEREGHPEEEIQAILSDLGAQKKAKAGPKGSAVAVASSNEAALQKENLELKAQNHEWKTKYRELEQEFGVLKQELETAQKSNPPPQEPINVFKDPRFPDFIKD